MRRAVWWQTRGCPCKLLLLQVDYQERLDAKMDSPIVGASFQSTYNTFSRESRFPPCSHPRPCFFCSSATTASKQAAPAAQSPGSIRLSPFGKIAVQTKSPMPRRCTAQARSDIQKPCKDVPHPVVLLVRQTHSRSSAHKTSTPQILRSSTNRCKDFQM